jgi:hypothetical protein
MKSLVAALLGLVLLVLFWRAYLHLRMPALVQRHGTIADFAALTRSVQPHDHLRATGVDAPNAKPDAPPLLVHVPAQQVVQAVETLFGDKILSRSADGRSFALVDRTRFLGFPDFVTLSVRSEANGARVIAYSTSVYGRRDFGTNQARIERWFALLAAKLR